MDDIVKDTGIDVSDNTIVDIYIQPDMRARNAVSSWAMSS